MIGMPSNQNDTAVLEQISQRRSKTLSTIVAEAIERMVITGTLSAGDRINESMLAAQLDVSRAPVREACRILEKAGLLISKVNRGVFVRSVTLEEARDLYEVRSALAGLAGRLVVQKAGDGEIEAIVGLHEQMGEAVERDDFDKYYALNVDFHANLISAASNSALREHDYLITAQLHQHRRRGLAQKESLVLSNREHGAIVDALTKRDESLAEEVMRQHVRGGWARVSAAI